MIEKLKSFIFQSMRVWRVLKKPSAYEFKSVSKIAAIGVLIIGAIGFLIADIIRLTERFFN